MKVYQQTARLTRWVGTNYESFSQSIAVESQACQTNSNTSVLQSEIAVIDITTGGTRYPERSVDLEPVYRGILIKARPQSVASFGTDAISEL